MITRKVTVCVTLFAFLIIGAALMDRHINRIHYPESNLEPFSYTDHLNNRSLKETSNGAASFYPREYIRIIRTTE